jgi:TorA maturation chaperone TorD
MEETGEAADHLLNELRFLIHLDQLRERCPSSADSLDRARRDFLDRHPLRWIPRASDRASDRGIAPFYRGVLTLLSAVVREDRMLLDGEDYSETRPRTS